MVNEDSKLFTSESVQGVSHMIASYGPQLLASDGSVGPVASPIEHEDELAGRYALMATRCEIVGSPDRLNLFTIEGDLLRVDLDLDAHMGSTLHNNSWIILEKGNRISPERLAAVRAAAEAEASGPGCSIM